MALKPRSARPVVQAAEAAAEAGAPTAAAAAADRPEFAASVETDDEPAVDPSMLASLTSAISERRHEEWQRDGLQIGRWTRQSERSSGTVFPREPEDAGRRVLTMQEARLLFVRLRAPAEDDPHAYLRDTLVPFRIAQRGDGRRSLFF